MPSLRRASVDSVYYPSWCADVMYPCKSTELVCKALVQSFAMWDLRSLNLFWPTCLLVAGLYIKSRPVRQSMRNTGPAIVKMWLWSGLI